jgi:hypothetical protein
MSPAGQLQHTEAVGQLGMVRASLVGMESRNLAATKGTPWPHLPTQQRHNQVDIILTGASLGLGRVPRGCLLCHRANQTWNNPRAPSDLGIAKRRVLMLDSNAQAGQCTVIRGLMYRI